MATWRPPERVKYTPLEAPWPDAAQVSNSRLFRPIQVGPLRLASRTWVPAMVPWRASEDGVVTPAVLAWYERFARGRPAALVVEATGVRDVASGPLLRIGHDRFLPGLEKIVDCVRKASDGETKLLIQLIDFLNIRRRPAPEKYFERFLKVTTSHREFLNMPADDETQVRARLATLSDAEQEKALSGREIESLRQGFRELVRDLPETLPGVFAAAAGRARSAGFDGVELHYAHAYTMASFLSARNTRNDGYGGTPSERIRLPLEVYRAVRAQVGSECAVGCRMLAEDCIVSLRTQRILRTDLPPQGWTSFPCRAAENLRTPRNRKSARLPTRTRGAAAMNACPLIIRMPGDPSGATSRRPRKSARGFVRPGSPRPLCVGRNPSFPASRAGARGGRGGCCGLGAPSAGRP